MPLVIDCKLKPARQRWWYICLIVALFMLFVWMQSVDLFTKLLLHMPIGLSIWIVFISWRSEFQFKRIRFEGAHIIFYDEKDQVQEYQWEGSGRISHAFIRFDLTNEEGILKWILWKDMVSEPSWRALNMAFYVHQSAARPALKDELKSELE